MFKSVHPVCPVLDMKTHLVFWQSLGFQVVFSDANPPETSNYAGIARENIEIHLQTHAPEELKGTQGMAIRVEMTDRQSLETLYVEWITRVRITSPLMDKEWGTREFGFYDPAGFPFFFYVDR